MEETTETGEAFLDMFKLLKHDSALVSNDNIVFCLSCKIVSDILMNNKK